MPWPACCKKCKQGSTWGLQLAGAEICQSALGSGIPGDNLELNRLLQLCFSALAMSKWPKQSVFFEKSLAVANRNSKKWHFQSLLNSWGINRKKILFAGRAVYAVLYLRFLLDSTKNYKLVFSRVPFASFLFKSAFFSLSYSLDFEPTTITSY